MKAIIQTMIASGMLILATAAQVLGTTFYVSDTTGDDGNDGRSWEAAKKTIQAGVDLCIGGETVLVANGVYRTGERVAPGGQVSNRVVILRNITLRSANGPAATVIEGTATQPWPCMAGAVRGVYMDAGLLSGFTVSNCQTTGDWRSPDTSGAGIYCASQGASVSNCMVCLSVAEGKGGGIWGGTVNNSILSSNISYFYGGGACASIIYNCTLSGNRGGGAYNCQMFSCLLVSNWSDCGGGALGGTLSNCTLLANISDTGGGGVYSDDLTTLDHCRLIGNESKYGGGAAGDYENVILKNCILVGNYASVKGGGSEAGCVFENCTITSNTAQWAGGGVSLCELVNTIVMDNFCSNDSLTANWDDECSFTNCCTTPLPSDTGSIESEPQFVNAAAGDFRLKRTSPCINAGSNVYVSWPLDLAGRERIFNGIVDIGAYEYADLNVSGALVWKQSSTKGTLTGTAITPLLKQYFEGGYRIGLKNGTTETVLDPPHVMTPDKTHTKWTFKDKATKTVITYQEKLKNGVPSAKLTYSIVGPSWSGSEVFLQK